MSHSKIDVILLHDFAKKGKFGETIAVKRGYAKNFLLPNTMALYANEANKKKFEILRVKAEQESELLKTEALKVAEQINGLVISIIRHSGPDSKIFGTVTPKDIAEKLSEYGIELERNKISIAKPIKYLGKYTISFILHPNVIIQKDITVGGTQVAMIDNEDEKLAGGSYKPVSYETRGRNEDDEESAE